MRLHRHQARLTLETLAARSDISRAALSKIERGDRNPSLPVAVRVADALGVPLVELLGKQQTPPVQVVRGPSPTRLVDEVSGATRESLLPAMDGVEVVRYTLPPHSKAGPFHPHRAGAREVFIVLEGALDVRSGTHRVNLETGDVAALPGDLSHDLTNPGDDTTRAMLILIRHATP